MPNAFTHGYALMVGVGVSAYPALSLPVTVKDIQAIRAILTDPNLCAYPGDDRHIRLNHDKTATRAAILDGLAWLKVQEGWEGVKQEAAETIRLYDKRFKVYYGLMELIAAVAQEANVGPRQLVKFCAETNESDFLFGPEIPIYLREVYSKAVEVRAQMTKLDGNGLPVGPERSKVAAQNSASLTWFNDQFEVAKAKFSPYLAFRNVK